MEFVQGNLLDSDVEALVNTVNTVGVMGKGIALMFKERFPRASLEYEKACATGALKIGQVFPVRRAELYGPEWIVHFPTKKHWRHPSKIEWIAEGLDSLRDFVVENSVRSIAIPPLGSGNGKLSWGDVRPLIEERLKDIPNVRIIVFEPTQKYQNVAKREGVEKLTPARAMVAEAIRRYSILGFECSLLEVQKLGYFLNKFVHNHSLPDPFHVTYSANKYGPYADGLRHLLNSIDGSYLQSDKRINDCSPFDTVRFSDEKADYVSAYFSTPEAKPFKVVLKDVDRLIDGFESPLGMELLATVDWLLREEGVPPTLEGVRDGLRHWSGGADAAARKQRLFDDRLIVIALERVG